MFYDKLNRKGCPLVVGQRINVTYVLKVLMSNQTRLRARVCVCVCVFCAYSCAHIVIPSGPYFLCLVM
jgi:hypothetical protein